jgi:cytochrome c oxidase accessory protein FixG
MTILLVVYVTLPWIEIGGHPAVFLDIPGRRFFLFGATLNAQDTWLLFFLLSGTGFTLILLAALFGRVFCGHACPQTVFLDAVFRRVERLIEGSRAQRMRRDRGPWNWDRLWRKLFKHSLYLLLSGLIAHVFLSYFVSLPGLLTMVGTSPAAHPQAFAWMLALTLLLHGNFGWFREQMCLIVCPYGRLQSALGDEDSWTIGYDARRGEPRGKLGSADAGDCVDCRRCVVVCPTAIDIRDGAQVDCIGCAACIDACDEVMGRLRRPRGLIRYDSLRGLRGEPRRVWRPRLALYALLGAAGLLAAGLAVHGRTPYEATLLRLPGPPYLLDGPEVRNGFEIHLVNKQATTQEFVLDAPVGATEYVLAQRRVRLDSMESIRIPLFAARPRSTPGAPAPVELTVRLAGRDDTVRPITLRAPFLAPSTRR